MAMVTVLHWKLVTEFEFLEYQRELHSIKKPTWEGGRVIFYYERPAFTPIVLGSCVSNCLLSFYV